MRLLSAPHGREPDRTASQARKGLVVLAILTLHRLPGNEQLREARSTYLLPISSNVTVSKRAAAQWDSAGQIQAPNSGMEGFLPGSRHFSLSLLWGPVTAHSVLADVSMSKGCYNKHKANGINNRNVLSHRSGGWKPEIEGLTRWFLLMAVWENLSFSRFLAASGVPWFIDGILLVSSHHLPSVRVSFCVQISPFIKDTVMLD